MKMQTIGKEKAIELANTEWWKDKTPREIVKFQLFTEELCMPFDVFHEAVNTVLERRVFTHEFASPFIDKLQQEFVGERDAPTMKEILNLIPEAKRIVVEI